MSGSRRGQALIETSVALLVAITVAVLGVHLAEVAEVAVKAPMLAHSALFDVTAHEIAAAGAGPVVSELNAYFPTAAADLDLRSSTGAARRYRGVFTTVPPLGRVATVHDSLIERPPACAYPVNDPHARMPASIDSGFSVSVALELPATSLRLPSGFGGGELGLFAAPALARHEWSLCALGRPGPGGCTGRLQVLVDDRALHYESPREGWDRADCALGRCANERFKSRASGRFAAGSGAASAMATAMLGSSPIDETKYWHSFRDASSDFRENGFETGVGPASRSTCWLGKACPP